MYVYSASNIFCKIHYEYRFIRDAGKNSVHKHEGKIEDAFKNKN